MEECYKLLGIPPTADTEEIEKAYLDKKREFAPSRFEQNSEEWHSASSMLQELDKAYNDAIMATFAPLKSFGTSINNALVHLPADKHPEDTSDEAVDNLDDLLEEAPVSFSDDQLLCMDAGQLRGSYDNFHEKSVLLTWGIKNDLLRRYVMTYAAFVVLGLIVTMLGGRPTHAVLGTMSAQQTELSARQADQGAELLYSIASAHAHLQIDPETAQQIRESAQQIREAAEQSREAAQQMRTSAAPPSILIAILMVFVATAYYFFCALPAPLIIRFLIMGEPASGVAFYIVSASTASLLFSLTSWLLGVWAGSMSMLPFVAILLCAVTIKYE